MFGGPFAQLGRWVEFLLDSLLASPLTPEGLRGPLRSRYDWLALYGYLVVDAFGLLAIVGGGWLARRLRKTMERREGSTAPRSP
jgi:hypothetical protein